MHRRSIRLCADGAGAELNQFRQRVSHGFGLAFPGLGSMQHDINANGIERKDDQAVFGLLQNAGV